MALSEGWALCKGRGGYGCRRCEHEPGHEAELEQNTKYARQIALARENVEVLLVRGGRRMQEKGSSGRDNELVLQSGKARVPETREIRWDSDDRG
jgi:hypothetical protein